MRNIFRNYSSEQTRSFYEGLSRGENKRGIWGKERRFDPDKISTNVSVLKHFLPVVTRHLAASDKCLDLGCGTGCFLSLMAPLCKTITGADIVPSFVNECQAMIERKTLSNANVVLLEKDKLPFADGEFDKIIMVDTIHHLEEPRHTMSEVTRVLKPGGEILIFEPNKFNPLLAVIWILDKNEYGFWPLGTFNAYKKLLGDAFQVEQEEFNGVVIGPDDRFTVALADFLSNPANRLLGWLSPKMFIAARKVSGQSE